MAWRELNPAQAGLLDLVEAAVLSVRHGLPCPGCHVRQVALALEAEGLYVTTEVPMSRGRRVDLVLVSSGGNVALEDEGREVPLRTVQKLRELPSEVLRVVVMRDRRRAPVVPFCDRVVLARTSWRPLGWLVSGGLPALDPVTGSLPSAPRLGPRSAGAPGSLLSVRRAR